MYQKQMLVIVKTLASQGLASNTDKALQSPRAVSYELNMGIQSLAFCNLVHRGVEKCNKSSQPGIS